MVRAGTAEEGATGLSYAAGISAETVGASRLCLQRLTIPPGGRARAHLHEEHESAIYVVSGEVRTWFGERLEESVVTGAGDFLYVPPGVPHLPVNTSDLEPAEAIVARTDPHAQESVVALPHLDVLPHLQG
ncbi:MAG TPA: cupin domain-containing protein [Gaiellaceae bacterium]